jgi:hypothetical protein
VAGEIVVDLMAMACGIDYETATADAMTLTIVGAGWRGDRGQSGDAYPPKNTVRP